MFHDHVSFIPTENFTLGTCGGTFYIGPPNRVGKIKAAVANFYGITVEELESARRGRDVAWPRQLAMALARDLTPMSLPDIGRRFGGRDHTTVIHAIKAVRQRELSDPDYAAQMRAVKRRLVA